jgi:hypothetical protein
MIKHTQMKSNIKNIAFIFFIISSLTSCCGSQWGPQQSPLSDIEISDPKLVTPEITIYTEGNNQANKPNTRIEVHLKDKNQFDILLKKGEVKINGKDCQKSDVGDSYYFLDNFSLDSKQKFEINIMLADNKVYNCTIDAISGFETPFYDVKYDSTNNQLIANWPKFNPEKSVTYTLNFFDKDFYLSSKDL